MSLSQKHILSVQDLSLKDIELIFQKASSFRHQSDLEIKQSAPLRGKTVLNCFFEDSTRTRVSFEIAEKKLSADSINISSSGSSMEKKGESFVDTIKNLDAMKPDVMVIRHRQSGAALEASRYTSGQVINAGDGAHEHPTQALLDAFTILEHKKSIKNIKVGIFGDLLHSRVARSNMLLLKKLGAQVIVGGPSTFMPPGIESYGVQVVSSLAEIVPELDVLMTLRIQKERLQDFFFPHEREYSKYFGVNVKTLAHAKKDMLIMHPGPVNRGVELSPDVADGPWSVVLDQVHNGVLVRMAILSLLLEGEKS